MLEGGNHESSTCVGDIAFAISIGVVVDVGLTEELETGVLVPAEFIEET